MHASVFLKLLQVSGSHNYFNETVRELVELSSVYDEQSAFVSTQNRFVNPKGAKDSFYEGDLGMEYQVRTVKAHLDSDGVNRNPKHSHKFHKHVLSQPTLKSNFLKILASKAITIIIRRLMSPKT
ncbi:hypothetical protein BC829DRAFT_400237 [Chytridium lagenaria]|nr:hypothetical protein BC829DRAFT_400237 [Chytridium lagenaria]